MAANRVTTPMLLSLRLFRYSSLASRSSAAPAMPTISSPAPPLPTFSPPRPPTFKKRPCHRTFSPPVNTIVAVLLFVLLLCFTMSDGSGFAVINFVNSGNGVFVRCADKNNEYGNITIDYAKRQWFKVNQWLGFFPLHWCSFFHEDIQIIAAVVYDERDVDKHPKIAWFIELNRSATLGTPAYGGLKNVARELVQSWELAT